MEVGMLGDHAAILMEMAASRADDDIEIIDCVEVFVGERFVDERPEVLGWLQFRAVGWLVDEPDAVGNGEVFDMGHGSPPRFMAAHANRFDPKRESALPESFARKPY